MKIQSFAHVFNSIAIGWMLIYVWLYFQTFYSIPLFYVSDSAPALYCFSYYSFASEVETRSKISPALFFLKIILSVWGLSGFHTEFRIIWSNSRKYIICTLIGIALNVDIALGCMNIITILILPIHEHKTSSHFCVSASVSFHSVLLFSVYQSCKCLLY